jgi:hypothetical protein
MSIIYNKNNKGPSTDPWGTPALTRPESDSSLLTNIARSALKQVNVLRKLKFILSKQALSNIYLTFIRPVLEYACEVWDRNGRWNK